MMIARGIAAVLVGLVASNLYAQQPIVWKPSSTPHVDLRQVAIARVDQRSGGESTLQVIETQYVPEEYQVTVYIDEVRTRTFTDEKTGVQREETYVVKVPIVESRMREVVSSVKREVPLWKLKAWSFVGKELTEAEIKQAFRTAKPCFVLSSDDGDGPPNHLGDPFYEQILSPNTVVLWYNAADFPATPLRAR